MHEIVHTACDAVSYMSIEDDCDGFVACSRCALEEYPEEPTV